MPRPPEEPFRRRGQPADIARPSRPEGGHRYRRGKDQNEIAAARQRERQAAREATEREFLSRLVAERASRAAEVPRKPRRDARWTTEACLNALQSFYASNGRTPRGADLTESAELPSISSVARLFGNFNAALVAAGLPLNHVAEHPHRWSDREILDAIRQAEAEGEPTSEPFRVGRRKPWIGTIERRFGSWRIAKALTARQPESPESAG